MTTNDEARRFPPLRSNVGRKGSITDIEGRKQSFTVVDEVRRRQSTDPEKTICLQRLRFDRDGRTELRLCYYIIGKKPRMAGKWVFGQFATMMPAEDFQAIVSRAEEEDWI